MKLWKIIKPIRKSSAEDYEPDVLLNQVIYTVSLIEKEVKPPDWMRKDLDENSLVDLYKSNFFFSNRGYTENTFTFVLSGTNQQVAENKLLETIKSRINTPNTKFKRADNPEQFQSFINLLMDEIYKGPFFVSLYQIDKRYGGPEEGGWWYDAKTFLKTLKKVNTITEAEYIRETMRQKYEEYDDLHDPAIYESLPEHSPAGIDEDRYPEGYIPTGFSTPDSYDIFIELAPGNLDTSKNQPPHYE